MTLLKQDWLPVLEKEFTKPYYIRLKNFLHEEYQAGLVYPVQQDIFNALKLTSYSDTKVVILGQDPYHGPNQAHGLSFSVKPGVKKPPSLQNIFKELQEDRGCDIPSHGHLVEWAQQGVLLLNTVLTVKKGVPNSHKGKGWESFTDQVIKALNERDTPLVFICWGKKAQEKQHLMNSDKHLILSSPHPSPFSANRGFFGSKPFTKANQFLEKVGRQPINWQITDDIEGV